MNFRLLYSPRKKELLLLPVINCQLHSIKTVKGACQRPRDGERWGPFGSERVRARVPLSGAAAVPLLALRDVTEGPSPLFVHISTENTSVLPISRSLSLSISLSHVRQSSPLFQLLRFPTSKAKKILAQQTEQTSLGEKTSFTPCQGSSARA